MELFEAKQKDLRIYLKSVFKKNIERQRTCSEGLYGTSQPVIVLRTKPMPEKYHLLFTKSKEYSYFSVPNNVYPEESLSLEFFVKNICFGPEDNLLSYCLTEEFQEPSFEQFNIGTFIHSNDTLAFIHCEDPLKLMLLKNKYPMVNSDTLIDVLNKIELEVVKEVSFEEYYKGGPFKTHRFPFFIFKINSVLNTINEKICPSFSNNKIKNLNYNKLREYMEKAISNKNIELFINDYYQAPERIIKYVLTILKKEILSTEEYVVYFAFKSLGDYYNFEIGREKNFDKAKEFCKSINSSLYSGDFQNSFRKNIEIFKNYNPSQIASFKFREGDCLLRPTDAIKNKIYSKYYIHGLFIGCENNCFKPKLCRLCTNVCHFSGPGFKESKKLFKKGELKAEFKKTTINSFLGNESFLRIKRNQFIRPNKNQYHQKVTNTIERFNALKKSEASLKGGIVCLKIKDTQIKEKFETRIKSEVSPNNKYVIVENTGSLNDKYGIEKDIRYLPDERLKYNVNEKNFVQGENAFGNPNRDMGSYNRDMFKKNPVIEDLKAGLKFAALAAGVYIGVSSLIDLKNLFKSKNPEFDEANPDDPNIGQANHEFNPKTSNSESSNFKPEFFDSKSNFETKFKPEFFDSKSNFENKFKPEFFKNTSNSERSNFKPEFFNNSSNFENKFSSEFFKNTLNSESTKFKPEFFNNSSNFENKFSSEFFKNTSNSESTKFKPEFFNNSSNFENKFKPELFKNISPSYTSNFKYKPELLTNTSNNFCLSNSEFKTGFLNNTSNNFNLGFKKF